MIGERGALYIRTRKREQERSRLGKRAKGLLYECIFLGGGGVKRSKVGKERAAKTGLRDSVTEAVGTVRQSRPGTGLRASRKGAVIELDFFAQTKKK